MNDLVTRLFESDAASALTNEAGRYIETQARALQEARQLLKDLDLGRSIHNARHPDQSIDGPLWAQISRVVSLPPSDHKGQ